MDLREEDYWHINESIVYLKDQLRLQKFMGEEHSAKEVHETVLNYLDIIQARLSPAEIKEIRFHKYFILNDGEVYHRTANDTWEKVTLDNWRAFRRDYYKIARRALGLYVKAENEIYESDESRRKQFRKLKL